MDISALTGSTAVSTEKTESSSGRWLSREKFMEILLAEMTHQDPMNPVDNQEFLSQLAQLQTLEATTALTEGIKSLVALQKLSSAGQLIGMTVRGEGPEGETIMGVVDRVVVKDNKVSVSVNGLELPLEKIEEMWREDEIV